MKLDFAAPLDLAPVIHQDCHLGLAGSSLTAREVSSDDFLIKFSIYCGRETKVLATCIAVRDGPMTGMLII